MEIVCDAWYVAVPRLIIGAVYRELKETMKVAVCLSVCPPACLSVHLSVFVDTFATVLFAV